MPETHRPTRRDPRHDILFEPLRIGPKTTRNRFYQVPHCSGMGEAKPFSQAEFRAMKAEGGWGVVSTEYAPICPESDESPEYGARIWNDEDAINLGLMAKRAHEHGSLAAIELSHSGAHALCGESRLPSIAPSQLASDFIYRLVPKEMDLDDIVEVRAAWVQAAKAAQNVGYDVIYVYGAHSYLPMQFLSPFYNRRTDQYGGGFENRARFWLELLEDVRKAVGSECAIACRISIDALGPAGVELDEGLAFIEVADELVDLWDVNVASITEWSKDSGASRFFAEGYQLEWTGKVRKMTSKPIVGVGRLTSPDKMADIVRSGVLDLIGAARPSIADPFLPSKIEHGRYDEIRECIGCNVCVMKAVTVHLGCTQNATAGEEYRRGWHPERFSRASNAHLDVLVVGAGPAGMECAIVLGKRQMNRVHLVEAADELGGSMRWIPRLPGLGEWARVVNWRIIQLERLSNVEVIRSATLDAAQVLEYGADLVVLATGATWSSTGVTGATHEPIANAVKQVERVFTPERIMVDGLRPKGERIIVYDGEGYFTAAGIAELLALEGYRVELVTCLDQIAPVCDETLEGPLLRQRLHEAGVTFRRATLLTEIADQAVLAIDEFEEPIEIPADAVVLVTQRNSNAALYRELAEMPGALAENGIVGLYRAGDCIAPRIPADAIFDGHRLGREIDSPDPSRALPYRREHAVVAATP